MKHIPAVIFALGTLVLAIDMLRRIFARISVFGTVEDAIALLLLAGVATLIWGHRSEAPR